MKEQIYRPFPDENDGVIHGVPMNGSDGMKIFTSKKKKIDKRAMLRELVKAIDSMDEKKRAALQLDKIAEELKKGAKK